VYGGIYHRTPTTHTINICEPLQVISVKVRFITPWWWILLWSETCWSNF